MGADAVLLIVAALDDAELAGLPGRWPARSASPPWSRSTTRPSWTGPSAVGADLIGVNQRDLRDLRGRPRAGRAAWGSGCPPAWWRVAESGIRDAADVGALADAGLPAVLVGETLVRSADRTGRRRRPARCPGMTAAAATGDPELFVKICGITSEADALLAVGMGAVGGRIHLRPLAPPDGPGGGGRHRQAPAPRDGHRRGLPRRGTADGWWRSPARSACGPCSCTATSRPRTPAGWPSGCPGRSRPSRPATATSSASTSTAPGTLLVDGPNPGSGELFDWRLAEGVVDPSRLIVSGGLRPENVAAAIAHLHPWGVDVATGVESSPGVKDPARMRDFIVAAREAGRLVASEPDAVVEPADPDGTAPVDRPLRLAGRP